MRGRRLYLVIGLAALVVVVGAAVWFVRRDTGPKYGPPLPASMAQPAAEETCSLMREFEAAVLANSDAEAALATLERAAVQSDIAARADVVWIRLDSGVRAVRAGFKDNNGAATRVGIDVVRDACKAVDRPPTP